MTAECFLDTNILLYACSAATADKTKRSKAEHLILNTNFALSSQVLQEFIANALRKKSLGISEVNIDAILRLASHVPVLPVTIELIHQAVTIRRQHQLGHWDSTIIAAARALDCQTLLKLLGSRLHISHFYCLEKMHPGLLFGRGRVCRPAPSGASKGYRESINAHSQTLPAPRSPGVSHPKNTACGGGKLRLARLASTFALPSYSLWLDMRSRGYGELTAIRQDFLEARAFGYSPGTPRHRPERTRDG